MRNRPTQRVDSLLVLFTVVAVGMLVTTVAQAENYLRGPIPGWNHEPSTWALQEETQDAWDLSLSYVPAEKNGWLISPRIRTSLQGGMAHLQFSLNDPQTGGASYWMPEHTRLIFSIGFVEQDSGQFVMPTRGALLHGDDRYQPTIFMSIGHRW